VEKVSPLCSSPNSIQKDIDSEDSNHSPMTLNYARMKDEAYSSFFKTHPVEYKSDTREDQDKKKTK
jgi:hypothetical protein